MEQNLETTIEQKQKKKKGIYIAYAILGVLVVAAAAFIGGRLLNQRSSPLDMLPFGGEGPVGSFSTDFKFTSAPELPTTAPQVVGTLAERKDNSIYIQTFSMDMGGGGVIVQSAGGAADTSSAAPVDPNNSPKVEVVITKDTLVYKDVTEFPANPGDETTSIQQVVELSNLEDVNSMTMLTVWGRKVGDRVIAEVIAYSNPIMIQRPVNP